MSVNVFLIFCAQALLIQSISAQCIGGYGAFDRFGYNRFGFDGIAEGLSYGAPLINACAGPAILGLANLAASRGSGFVVSSSSPIMPIGVSIVSENGYEGSLVVGGVLPFVGTVALEGALPTAGAGAIAYGCGNGQVNINTEDLVTFGYVDKAEPILPDLPTYGAGYAGFAEPFVKGFQQGRPFGYRASSKCGAFY